MFFSFDRSSRTTVSELGLWPKTRGFPQVLLVIHRADPAGDGSIQCGYGRGKLGHLWTLPVNLFSPGAFSTRLWGLWRKGDCGTCPCICWHQHKVSIESSCGGKASSCGPKIFGHKIRTVENTVKSMIFSSSPSSFVPKYPLYHKGWDCGLWFTHKGLCSNSTTSYILGQLFEFPELQCLHLYSRGNNGPHFTRLSRKMHKGCLAHSKRPESVNYSLQ